jgi:urea transport system substrate-binding protein
MLWTLHAQGHARLGLSAALLLGLLPLLTACPEAEVEGLRYDGYVRVGVLHSRTGTMAISENTAAEAELMAIREINEAGGLDLGDRRMALVAVEEDGASDWPTFARKAEKLIERDEVAVLFGGWTSASRKAMLPVLEAHDHLLFYPIQYEGQECSRQIFYAGATPNQQIGPALDWLAEHHGLRWFLVGSDYVYPRTANAIIRAGATGRGAEVVGERYLPLGSRAVEPLIDALRAALPTGGVILNTLNGGSNFAFFQALAAANIDAAHGYAVMSFSIAEEEVAAIGPEFLAGSYAVWNFFHGDDTPSARAFAEAFQKNHGLHRVTSAPAAAAYSMVHLWARAAEQAGTTEVSAVREALMGTIFEGPAGRLKVEKNHHISQTARIGEVQRDGTFAVLEEFGLIEPKPWSPEIEESQGDRCDWTLDRSDAGRFRG